MMLLLLFLSGSRLSLHKHVLLPYQKLLIMMLLVSWVHSYPFRIKQVNTTWRFRSYAEGFHELSLFLFSPSLGSGPLQKSLLLGFVRAKCKTIEMKVKNSFISSLS